MGMIDTIRNTFTGRNDKYIDLDSYATIIDPTGTYFTDTQRDYANKRIQRYKESWAFYNGSQFKKKTNEGADKLVFNLIKPIVNKSVDWLFGHGFKICTPPGNEALIPLLNTIWDANNRDLMMWEHGQMGAVAGDAFLYVTVEDRSPDGTALPIDDQKIVIANLNPAYVHPVYDFVNPREMKECLIQYPTVMDFNPIKKERERTIGIYSILIKPDEVVEFWNNQEIEGSRRPNFLGRVNVVHTRNIPLSNSFFGLSDIEDAIPLNEHLNKVGNNIADIIDYHAAPTTIIFGARAQSLEKGPNKLWSGLPKDAHVQNLELNGQLEAAVEHFNSIKLSIHEVTNTPESSLGKVQSVSNTSGAAMEVQYLPLIEKTRRKYLTYGQTIVQVNELLIQIMDQRFGMNLMSKVNDEAQLFVTSVEFNSPLPTDRKLQVDMITAKLDRGIESKAGALRELGEKDPHRKMAEIIGDQRQTLAEDVERALASTGVRPVNLSVYALGSFALNMPELQQAFDAQDAQYDKLLNEAKEINNAQNVQENEKTIDKSGLNK